MKTFDLRRLFSIALCAAFFPTIAAAQDESAIKFVPAPLQPATLAMIDRLEGMFVQSVRKRHPDFDYVKEMKRYPERVNATLHMEVMVEASEQARTIPALVTLHDGTTGAALESCFAPCTLNGELGQSYILSSYRRGYVSAPRRVLNSQDRQLDEPDWNGEYRLNAGFNFARIALRRNICERRFARMTPEDREAVPCYRAPPLMPGTNFSGYCRIGFDLDQRGNTVNHKVVECTDQIFEGPSLLAVSSWKYHPKIERGTAVGQTGLVTKVRFDIKDYDGHLLDQAGNRVE